MDIHRQIINIITLLLTNIETFHKGLVSERKTLLQEIPDIIGARNVMKEPYKWLKELGI